MDKEDVVYASTVEYYSANKKNKMLSIAAPRMDLEGIMLVLFLWNKSEKDK